MINAFRARLARTFASLARYNYRLYFTGYTISSIGTWMQWVAFGWYTLTRTDSGLQLGIVQALQCLPVLLLSPWAGLIADRFDQRRILLASQALLALLSLGAGVLIWMHLMTIPLLYALAFATGIVTTVDSPTIAITFPSRLVGDDLIKNAASLNALSFNTARIIGPAIAGVLIAIAGTPICFIVDALSFCAMLFALLIMHTHEIEPCKPVSREKGQVIAGFRYARAHAIIFPLLATLFVVGTFTFEFQVSLPLFAKEAFNGDAGTLALLFSLMGVGAIIGALVSASQHGTTLQQAVIWLVLFGISITATSLMPIVPLALVGMACIGFTMTVFMATIGSLLQTESDASMRGRIGAMRSMATQGTTPIGAPIIGIIGEHFGGRFGLLTSGLAACMATIGLVYTMRQKHSRKS